MTDNNSNLTEDLASEIENAVDDLFGRYELGGGGAKKTEEPQSAPEPPAAEEEAAEPPAPEPEIELTLESEPAVESEPAAPQPQKAPPSPPPQAPPAAAAPTADAKRLLAEMEEAILTVDWEVNDKNVKQARAVLAGLRNALNLAGTAADEVAGLMDDVLKCMEETPSDAPTTGPAHLKDGLAAIQAWFKAGGIPDKTAGEMLEKAARELRESLPVAQKDGVIDLGAEETFDLTMELESAAKESPAPPQPQATEIQVPHGMERVLKTYSDDLARAIKRLTPMDELFGRTPGMEKLHRLTTKVLGRLRELADECAACFNGDFTRATGKAAEGGDINTFLDAHRSVLAACVNRLLPMEGLFEKNQGYEKLHRLTKKIRSGLEREQDALERAAAGDYEPAVVMADVVSAAAAESTVSPAAESAPAADSGELAAVAADVARCLRILDDIEDGDLVETVAALANVKEILSGLAQRLPAVTEEAGAPAAPAKAGAECPWPILMKSVWGGRTVAFIPEQVAYQSPKKISARKAGKTSFFALKKLKSAPWTNLQNLVSGELANEPKRVLNKMEFPVMHPPEDFPGSTMKKQTMALLFKDGLGKACFLDAPMEVMHVPDDAGWKEQTDATTGLAGVLTVDGEEIPVFSL